MELVELRNIIDLPLLYQFAPEKRRKVYRRVWFVAYGATPRHTSRAAGVAAESAAAA